MTATPMKRRDQFVGPSISNIATLATILISIVSKPTERFCIRNSLFASIHVPLNVIRSWVTMRNAIGMRRMQVIKRRKNISMMSTHTMSIQIITFLSSGRPNRASADSRSLNRTSVDPLSCCRDRRTVCTRASYCHRHRFYVLTG